MYNEPSRVERGLRDIWPIAKTGITNVLFFLFGTIKYIISEGVKMIRNQY